MAGYIGSKAVSVNTTSATISDDLAVGDDLTVTDDATIGGTALVTGVLTTTAATVSNGGGQFNGAINVGVDDTGYDVKFFGNTASAYMQWDASTDDLILGGASRLGIGVVAPESGLHISDGTNVRAPQNANRKGTLIIEAGSEGSADIQFLNASYNQLIFGDAADANVGSIYYTHSNNTLGFSTNAGARFTIENNGDVTIEDGNLVVGTAGHGIDFSAQTQSDQSVSTTTSELLDHYEEGTWTPIFGATSLVGGSGSGETLIAYNQQTGFFTRIGNTVYIQGNIRTNGRSGTERSVLTVDGLPFAVNGTCNGSMTIGFAFNFATAAPLSAIAQTSQTHLLLYTNAVDNTNLTTSNIVDSGQSYFNFEGFYTV